MSLFQLVETNLSMVLYKTRTLTEKQQNLTTPKKTESIQIKLIVPLNNIAYN